MAVILGTTVPSTRAQEDADRLSRSAEVSYTPSAETIVFEYRRRPAQPVSDDYTVYLRLFGDGRVVFGGPLSEGENRHLTSQLSESEMRSLLNAVVGKGLIEFDSKAVRSLLRSRIHPEDGFVSSPDADISSFEINLDEYRPGRGVGRGEVLTNVHRRVVWGNLRRDAWLHSDIRVLKALSELETELIAFINQTAVGPTPAEED